MALVYLKTHMSVIPISRDQFDFCIEYLIFGLCRSYILKMNDCNQKLSEEKILKVGYYEKGEISKIQHGGRTRWATTIVSRSEMFVIDRRTIKRKRNDCKINSYDFIAILRISKKVVFRLSPLYFWTNRFDQIRMHNFKSWLMCVLSVKKIEQEVFELQGPQDSSDKVCNNNNNNNNNNNKNNPNRASSR